MAKGGSSISCQSGMKWRKEKKAMMKRLKKMSKALKQNTLFLKNLIQEQENLMRKINSPNPYHNPSQVFDSDEAWQASQVSGPTIDDECRSSERGDDLDDDFDHVSDVDLQEKSRFIKMATSVLQGYNANEGKKYEFHKIVTVISTYEIPVRYYVLTFEVKNLEAAAGHAVSKTCRAKIAVYGFGESYVESCRIKKNPHL